MATISEPLCALPDLALRGAVARLAAAGGAQTRMAILPTGARPRGPRTTMLSEDSTGSPSARLIERIRSGDRNAERELWLAHAATLTLIVRRRTRNPDLTQDVVQETFRVAIGHLRAGRIEKPDALGGFLRGIALNVLSVSRRNDHREAHLDDDGAAVELVDDGRSPFEATSLAQRQEFVRRLIAELPIERDRQLLWHYYVLDEEKNDVCASLGLTAGHFDRVLHRARTRFRELVERCADGRQKEVGYADYTDR